MVDVGPGDWLECINDGRISWNNTRLPKGDRVVKGQLYQVASGGVHLCGPEDEPWVCVVGMISKIRGYPPIPDGAYRLERFRPISRRSDFESILTTLKQPTLQPV